MYLAICECVVTEAPQMSPFFSQAAIDFSNSFNLKFSGEITNLYSNATCVHQNQPKYFDLDC